VENKLHAKVPWGMMRCGEWSPLPKNPPSLWHSATRFDSCYCPPPTPETPLRRRTVFWRSFTYVSRHRSSSHAERWPASKLASYGDTEIVSSWRQQRHQQVPAATSSELRAAYTFFSLLYLFNTSASRAAAYKCTEYRPWSLATVRPCGFRKRVTFTFDLLTYASMHAERLL